MNETITQERAPYEGDQTPERDPFGFRHASAPRLRQLLAQYRKLDPPTAAEADRILPPSYRGRVLDELDRELAQRRSTRRGA